MNKKGFTLIEILAVIVILGVILGLTIPAVLGVIERSKQKAYDIQAKNFEEAAKDYVLKEGSSIVELANIGNIYYVTLTELYDKGYIDEVPTNPKTGTVFDSDNSWIKITKTKNSFTYDLTLTKISLDTSGASAPKLAGNMIAVYYDGGVWKKADVTNMNSTYKWYDYTNKIWANAVTLTAAGRSAGYLSAASGTTIPDAYINAYYVWIPRYRYKISTGGTTTPSSISIIFEGSNKTKATGNAVTTYLTHPAFTFGNKELSGIWIAKFETTGTTSALTVLPTTSSLRGIQLSVYYTAIRNMESSGNAYGFETSEVDTHIIKNSEWGAVAYLTNSLYGKNSEVWTNPSSTYLTGSSGSVYNASSTTTVYAYNDTTYGVNASTTGNVYGIYDMSGGAWESVMGNYLNYSGYAIGYNSGFNGPTGNDGLTYTAGIAFPASKYYNYYSTAIASTACNGGTCLGHALKETAGWNSDVAAMCTYQYPWLVRGGHNVSGVGAGIFAYSNSHGSVASGYPAGYVSTRIAITIENVGEYDFINPVISIVSHEDNTYTDPAIGVAVTVTDNVKVDTTSLKYVWSTSTTAPATSSFTNTFTNGATVYIPSNISGTYYLWILAKDTSGNTAITSSTSWTINTIVVEPI